jgi:TRAP-type C4-dicarboxylate transport system permease small subunit
VRFGLIWVSLLGAAYGFGKKHHLSMDLLTRRLGGRGRLGLEIFIQVSVIAFAFLVLVVGGSRLVDLTLALGQTSAALQIKRGYVYLALPLSGWVVMFYAALSLRETLHRS